MMQLNQSEGRILWSKILDGTSNNMYYREQVSMPAYTTTLYGRELELTGMKKTNNAML
jgi:hypothetical protein